MEQFEQLLTCAICLDRYRNPKLLPCQHSFCMEPCMDGLVDYVRRQVKCPECRAEHRIPYQGVQGYPTNVTLQRFLELHIEITGELPDPTSGQIMKRCNVCSEKAYCTMCLHCDKEICPECKGAHKDILRREISRITNQIRRALHRLEDILTYVEKSMLALQQNCTSVSEEVEELYSRLNKALKDRTEYLRNEIDRYLTSEHKNLSSLKENLEVEISNIQSNCDLADKYMQNEIVEWDDCELMDAKEIFLKTVEFIRYFETETGDYTRRAKFIMAHEPNQLVSHVAGYGDLSINNPHQFLTSGNTHQSSGNMLQPPGPGLMRSKSDHRLASQFRQQEERGYDGNSENCGRVSPLGGRKFGERYPTRSATSDRLDNRYGRTDRDYGTDLDSGYDNEGGRTARSRIRSRLARHGNENTDSDTDVQNPRSVRFSDTHVQHPREKERDRVLDTEDVAKGPLSGITRLYDSPRVMKRLQESETKKTKKEMEPTPIQQKFQPPPQRRLSNVTPVTQRQVSEDDEISRIKRQNKTTTTPAPAEVPAETHRAVPERVSSLRRDDSRDERQVSSPNRSSVASDRNRKTPVREAVSSDEESNDEDKEEETVSSLQTQRRSSKTPVTTNSRRSSASSDILTQPGGVLKKSTRSASSDSSASTESSTGSSSGVRNTGAAFTTDELRQQYLSRAGRESSSKTTVDSNSGNSSPRTKAPPVEVKKEVTPTGSRFQSRFLTGANRTNSTAPPINEKPKAENVEEDNDDEEETETSSESEETESEEETPKKPEPGAKSGLEKTDIGPLLARSANARDNGSGSASTNASYRRNSRDDGSSSSSRFNTNTDTYRPSYSSKDSANRSSKYLSNNRNDEPEPKSRFTSRFLNKSKSTAMAPPDEDDFHQGTGRRYSGNDDSIYSRREPGYTSFKDRKARLARSKSTHGFGEDLEGDLDDNTASSYYPASYLASKASNAGNDLSRSRSSHVLKSRENSPERPLSSNTGSEKDGSSLSSWARYLKNKYGNRSKDIKDNNLSSVAGSSGTSATSRRLSLGLPLRGNNSASVESSDDDQKNLEGSPNSPTAATAVQAGFAEVGTTLRSQYMQKRQLCFKIGSRGSGPGCFTWPRGIAVGPDNSIVVADSSNHRVQVFDQNGRFSKEFGGFGNGEGEFDCLAGIAVNRIGQYIIADRYNHRVQVLDPSGRFLRSFGSQGTADGKFNYPWGITTDALGFIYVCDKENHRIQVFQSDGTFVGKFGSYGNKIGQLEHPHYIAVSNTNRVIVSDSNNHRVQIFDVNGRVLNSIAGEGSANGQFKFPRGVAVDDQGYILVGDSGNNRIQIFHPDGTFLRSFGCWGSGDGEFKGLEGVAVMSNGNILVCDRENHRVQVF